MLKLSTMWEFTEIRKRAMDELLKMKMEMGNMEMIELGRCLNMKEWWLKGYVGLLMRRETITDEEAEHPGWKQPSNCLACVSGLVPKDLPPVKPAGRAIKPV